MSRQSGGSKRITPSKCAHFVVRTTPDRFEEMWNWYRSLLCAEVVFRKPVQLFHDIRR